MVLIFILPVLDRPRSCPPVRTGKLILDIMLSTVNIDTGTTVGQVD
jgi:hypothetical protein